MLTKLNLTWQINLGLGVEFYNARASSGLPYLA